VIKRLAAAIVASEITDSMWYSCAHAATINSNRRNGEARAKAIARDRRAVEAVSPNHAKYAATETKAAAETAIAISKSVAGESGHRTSPAHEAKRKLVRRNAANASSAGSRRIVVHRIATGTVESDTVR
jgi:hypothetical protein